MKPIINRRRRNTRLFLISVAVLFVLTNVLAYTGASKFTRFEPGAGKRTKDPAELSLTEKIKTIVLGVNNPRPENLTLPQREFETVFPAGNIKTECWYLKADSAIGTAILFHGYCGNKSLMLDKADVFLSLNYHVLLVDFMGSGGSEGNTTTIGFKEAEQVKSCLNHLVMQGETNITLFGTSMGAVAIMKAVADYELQPSAIILECPFGTMLETVKARFKTTKLPSFPMAQLLVFWGGLQNNFNAFNHNPGEYAKQIKCPTLLMYGQKDVKVSMEEITRIFNNLQGEKQLKLYPRAGHENYLNKYQAEWTTHVKNFLAK